MADDDNKIVVQIELDDGSVRQGFIRVQNQGESTFKKIGEVAAGVFGGQLLTKAFDSIKDSLKEIFSEAISSAREAEKNVQGLNVALGVAGRYSVAASEQFQALADNIQRTTTVSDDTVLSLEKLAITYTKTNTQALKLTETSVDLAAVTGQDVNSAMQQLAGTLSGSAGRLQKLFPELQNFTAAQLKAGAAVDFFNSKFAGAAAAQVNTFDGRILQLHNNIDDFLKSLGKIVTSSPAVISVIKFLSDQFANLAGYFKQFQGQDLLRGPILSIIAFGRAITTYVIAPTEMIYNTFVAVFTAVKTLVQGQVAFYSTIASKLVGYFAPNSSLAKTIQQFSESSTAVLGDFVTQTTDAFVAIGTDFTATAALDGFLEKLDQTVAAAQPVKDTFAALGAGAAQTSGEIKSLKQTFDLLKEGATAALEELNSTGQKVFRELGGTAIKSFANAVSSGMAAIGKALVKGQDIFKAFAGAMLSALGQAAIQMGATYILLGLARGFSSYGFDSTAGELIAVGSALSVLGGAMAAVGEGVSGTGSSSFSGGVGGSSSAAPAGAVDTTATTAPAESVKADNGPNVTVHIQGDVLDSKESGIRIVEIINDAFNTSGAKVQTS